MYKVRAASLPPHALLERYKGDGTYADCYAIDVPIPVSHEAFVAAFYTTRVFKLERWLLHVLVSRPSRDRDAQQMAAGTRDSFAAWAVESRTQDQVLLCDMTGRTRSWLMTATEPGSRTTRLFFGSAVVPVVDRTSGERKMGLVFHLLLGFHRAYSRVLLVAAARALARSAGA